MKTKKALIFAIILILSFTFNLNSCFAISEEPDIIAESAILMDMNTERILYSKDPYEKMYPASTTKILTAIIMIENCNLDDIVTVPYEAISSIPTEYVVAGLTAGEQLTVKQILQLMLVHSANDAANVAAYHISNSIDDFATIMNNKLKDIGIQNTHFTNPSGMHDDNHYTTAYDMAILMKYCMKNPTFRELSGLKYCTIPATNKYNEERVFNTSNELIIYDNRDVNNSYYYKYAIAGKTGYTPAAKNCLVAVSEKDDLQLISVVLGVGMYPNNLSGRFLDTKSLFEYGYNNFTLRKLRDKDAIITQIEIENATSDTKDLNLLLSDDMIALVSQDDLATEFTPAIELNENLSAPISERAVVGKIKYNIDGIEYTSTLLASHKVDKQQSFLDVFKIFIIVLILYLIYKILFDNKNIKFGNKHTNNTSNTSNNNNSSINGDVNNNSKLQLENLRKKIRSNIEGRINKRNKDNSTNNTSTTSKTKRFNHFDSFKKHY